MYYIILHLLSPPLQALACTNIKHLDLSKNDLRGKGMSSLCNYFKFEAASTGLQILDVSHCHLTPIEASNLFTALITYKNSLEYLSVAGNKIGPKHTLTIAQYIGEADRCHLKYLDLSWTDIGETGDPPGRYSLIYTH